MTNKKSVQGLGNDILEIKRIQDAIAEHKNRFLDRIFSKQEQMYCDAFKDNAAAHYAGRFAAKEAVAKALGVGIGEKLSWHDIEIVSSESGKPEARLSPKAQQRFGNPSLLVSISHCREYVIATAIAF